MGRQSDKAGEKSWRPTAWRAFWNTKVSHRQLIGSLSKLEAATDKFLIEKPNNTLPELGN